MSDARRPACAGPDCNKPVAIGKRGKPLMYCKNPNCRKRKWDRENRSAKSRATIDDNILQMRQQLTYMQLTLDDLATRPTAPVATGATEPTMTYSDTELNELDLIVTKQLSEEEKNQQAKTANDNFLRSLIKVQASVGTHIEISGINDGNAQQLAGSNIEVAAPADFDDLDIDLAIAS